MLCRGGRGLEGEFWRVWRDRVVRKSRGLKSRVEVEVEVGELRRAEERLERRCGQ